jgi:hypothetical protein
MPIVLSELKNTIRWRFKKQITGLMAVFKNIFTATIRLLLQRGYDFWWNEQIIRNARPAVEQNKTLLLYVCCVRF